MFEYRARIRSAYDADTIRMDIDLGMSTWKINEPIRLARINAPEIRGAERKAGITARDYVRDLLPPGRMVVIQTTKDKKGKFGRYVAEVVVQGVNLNDRLVSLGLAEYHEY